MTALALSVMFAGTVAREVLVVLGAYVLLIAVLGRSRALLRAIDAGDRSRDGRRYAFFAWFLGMAGSALSVLAILQSLLG